MEVIEVGGMAEELVERVLEEGSTLDEVIALDRVTRKYFEVRDGEKPLAYGGECAASLTSAQSVLWLVLAHKTFSLRELRRGLSLAREYLASREGELFCEINPASRPDARFARSCGFTFLRALSDREQYKWNA